MSWKEIGFGREFVVKDNKDKSQEIYTIESNYVGEESFIMHMHDDDIIYLHTEDELFGKSKSMSLNSATILRDWLDGVIKFAEKNGYNKKVNLTKQQIEKMLGYEINIIKGETDE